MCFASSLVEAHKKLFLEPIEGASSSALTSGTSPSGGSSISKLLPNTDKRQSKMSRSKSRIQTEVCGDCGASDPSWASINRGILLCSDCCSVHRSLGRHISIVKSLRQGTWEPSVLNFVNSLNAHGANSVWEHHLLDGTHAVGSKNTPRVKKPTPKDNLPLKTDFIKAKHVNLTYVLKPNLQDDDVVSSNLEMELSKQLHASVRTSNLETSLRLLVQGADPNFFHEEKCSTPLHVAAKFGQASQIELLLVYGADINAIDGNGLTPLEVAKANNHNTIAERLLDAMYEVTDRLIMFLGGKKPDHATGRHLVIPELNNSEISEQLKIARNRLQLVPNKMFEELVMDLYDEVDRRENEAIWTTSTINADTCVVPFLPANPFLSATRNQGRQKLARFTKNEFAGLITDVLLDALRRQKLANLRPLENAQTGNSSFCNLSSSTAFNSSSGIGGVSGMDYDPNLSDDEPIYDPVASDDDYAQVPQPIAQQNSMNQMLKIQGHQAQPQNQFEVEILRKQLNEYQYEINQLKTVVEKLSSENSELKSKFSSVANINTSSGKSTSNPSVYDEPLRIDLSNTEVTDNEPQSLQEINSNSSASTSATNSNQSTIKRPASMYEQRRLMSNQPKVTPDLRTTTSMYAANASLVERPLSADIKRHTDIVTRCLKDLVVSLQDANGLMSCAERIRIAVMDLISIFTNPGNLNENIRDMLKQLNRYIILIQHACENLQKAFDEDDKAGIEKFTFEVRQCAYYIASTIKTLVVQFD